MTWAIVLAAAVLAGVASAGLLRPFMVPREVALDRLADPLEDERTALLRSLRDLEEERASGALGEESYRLLRAETEVRAVAVLRALEARDGADSLTTGLGELKALRQGGAGPPNAEPAASTNGHATERVAGGRPSARIRVIALVTAGAALVAVVATLMVGAVRGRQPGAPITGFDQSGAGASSNPLTFFLQRVRDHPTDVAARLDLAARYLAAGDVQDGIAQYLVALRLDPANEEARANLGFLLFRAGRPEEALRSERLVLASDPTYAEAMYFSGVILLEGLHRPADAAAAFQDYLRTAPFGSHRQEVEALLRRAEREAEGPATAGASPSPSPGR